MLLTVTLQVIGRHFRLARPERMLHRLTHFAAAGEPLTGAQMRLGRRPGPGHALQHQRQRSPQAKPLAAVVDLAREQLEGFQRLEDFTTDAVQYVIAQLRRETRHPGQGEECMTDLLALPLEHFALHVVAQQLRARNEPLAQSLLVGIEQHQTDPRQPAFAAGQQLLETVIGELQAMQLEQLPKLVAGQGQRGSFQLEQVAL